MSRSSDRNSTQAPAWYTPGAIDQSVQDALNRSSVSITDIVEVLREQELDAPRERVVKIVETARDQLTDKSDTTTFSPTSVTDTRAQQTRYVTLADLSYLETRKAATLIGAMLSRIDGAFRITEPADEEAADLLWTRSDGTVGLFFEWKSDGEPLRAGRTESIGQEMTQPGMTHSSSDIVIVSLDGFTEEAKESATTHSLSCCGPAHLDRWCRIAQLPDSVAGELLSDGDTRSERIDDLFAELPPVPDSISDCDPFDLSESEEWSVSQLARGVSDSDKTSLTELVGEATEEEENQTQSDQSTPETPSAPGQQGVLYADPAEDGDFGAFERFENRIGDDQ